MEQKEVKVLVLSFNQEKETRLFKLNINNPNDTLLGSEIKTAADAIVATQVLGEKTRVTAVKEAYYTIRTLTEIDLSQA